MGKWKCKDKDGKWLSRKTEWFADLERGAKNGVCSSVPIQVGNSKKTVALIVWEGLEDTEAYKNAYLIAAAPELLEALEAILSPLVNNNHDGMELWKSDDQYHNAVAAIAKAKGA